MEPSVTSRETAEHYVWGEGCDGWHLLRTPGLSVIEERMPPGTAETRHSHERAQQLFFVLSGELAVELPGGTRRVGPLQALHVPAGLAHRVRNGGSGDARFLVISEPPSHGDRFDAPDPAAP
jgi:mannose-6-phosphate isomerase-like protein (cupin superfamily)